MEDNTDTETAFLFAARNGDTNGVRSILEKRAHNYVSLDMNCAGNQLLISILKRVANY